MSKKPDFNVGNRFKLLKSYFKRPPTIIDNVAYKVHYRASFIILVASSLLVTSQQFFGAPIICITKDQIPPKLIGTYCWLHSTFSMENAWHKRVGDEVPYPGVDKSSAEENRVYHAYYQWVAFVLFFQALFFYLPRYIWKNYLGARVTQLVRTLNKPILDDKKRKEIADIVEYFHINRGHHNKYFYCYAITEVLNFVNVIVQMIVVDHFLGGLFSTYGWDAIKFSEYDWSVRYDPMIKVFPRITKCTFHRFGTSGDIQKHDTLCILPINIVNEKIYVFLWFWFYLVAIVSALALIHRATTYLFNAARVIATHRRCTICDRYEVAKFVRKVPIGDWFMLDLLSRNMDSLNFRELIVQLNNNQ